MDVRACPWQMLSLGLAGANPPHAHAIVGPRVDIVPRNVGVWLMRYRRCHAVAVLPEEQPVVSLQSLTSGEPGIQYERSLRVHAAHIDTVCVLDADTCMFLFGCSAEKWQLLPPEGEARDRVMALVEMGLLLLEEDPPSSLAQADQRVRAGNWWPLSAIHHRHSRWDDIDSVGEMERRGVVTTRDLVHRHGPPPPEAPERWPNAISLPRLYGHAARNSLESRVTCRNFDTRRALPLEVVAAMLQDVLMAQGVVESEPGVRFLKKNVPSGGGLHPLEAYVIARDVEGLRPGVYHYHSVAHELARVPGQPEDLDAFMLRLLAGQHWFAGAHVMVVLVCRFQRNFWKYRRHVKAYRAIVLDVGHISQAFYTAATMRGLGAFVTAAINEAGIEKLLQSDPMVEGALAVCGFGWRGSRMVVEELDPCGHIWQAVPAG